jgi:hypothetical protein
MKNSDSSTFNIKRSQAEETRLELKREWKSLWNDKFDDEKIAEGVSTEDYSQLYVDKGQIIYATRGCKSLDFHEILEKKIGRNYSNKISPPPQVGGWRKFAKDNLTKKTPTRDKPKIKVDLSQQQRKNGRGWKNQIRINKKIQVNKENNRY